MKVSANPCIKIMIKTGSGFIANKGCTLIYRIIDNTIQCESICRHLLSLHVLVSCDHCQKAQINVFRNNYYEAHNTQKLLDKKLFKII
jgi:hypothetical protein